MESPRWQCGVDLKAMAPLSSDKEWLQRRDDVRHRRAERPGSSFLLKVSDGINENLRRGWYHCLERAGVREVRFHDLRHTFVSLLIKQGGSSKVYSRTSRHSSIQVTMDTYGLYSRVKTQSGSTSWMRS